MEPMPSLPCSTEYGTRQAARCDTVWDQPGCQVWDGPASPAPTFLIMASRREHCSALEPELARLAWGSGSRTGELTFSTGDILSATSRHGGGRYRHRGAGESVGGVGGRQVKGDIGGHRV